MGKRRYTQTRASRNLSLPAIARLTDEQSLDLLRLIRFADTGGEPYCPRCWSKKHVRTRIVWRPCDDRWFCTTCRRPFGILTGTAWNRLRNPHAKLLILANFVTSSSGEPHIEIARKSNCDPTTTYYFLMRMREALHLEMSNEQFSGEVEVEVDGCWMGGFNRPPNSRAYERFLKRQGLWKKRPKKVFCAMRERSTGRTFVAVHDQEHEFIPTVIRKLKPGSTVYSDMSGSWDPLAKHFTLRSVNHAERYWSKTASTQMAEALFHRHRRLEKNLVHISGDYLAFYGAETGFRQSFCGRSDAEKFLWLIATSLRAPTSRLFSGIWQRKAKR